MSAYWELEETRGPKKSEHIIQSRQDDDLGLEGTGLSLVPPEFARALREKVSSTSAIYTALALVVVPILTFVDIKSSLLSPFQ